uniref:Exonuclease 1-like n=1 Tax=Dermatophagoides pteronyssinus TaxID=6956 RepID=A0A6P6Y9L6_DERPT|nr:exonuclease 1-like [Dermatophagoides pteronyssinus]
MGCKGLHQAIRENTRFVSVKQFSHKRCAIDAYSWLHRAAYSDVKQVTSGLVSKKVTASIIRKVKTLLNYSIDCVFVFDGVSLPSKKKTDELRRSQRATSLEKAAQYRNKSDRKNEFKYLSAAVSVSWEQVKDLIDNLRELNIKYLVAPYEADSQLAFLNYQNYVDFIFSEDSDLLLYGAKVMLTKYESDGTCIMIKQEALIQCDILPVRYSTSAVWTLLCCLSGCDYTDGIKGIGIKKGAKVLVKTLEMLEIDVHNIADDQIKKIFKKACEQITDHLSENTEIIDELTNAFLTFRYHWVYDPISQQCVNISKVENCSAEISALIGPKIENDELKKLVSGSIHPITKVKEAKQYEYELNLSQLNNFGDIESDEKENIDHYNETIFSKPLKRRYATVKKNAPEVETFPNIDELFPLLEELKKSKQN